MRAAMYSRTINGPELCHSALAEACEKEIVAQIMRGEFPGFWEEADAYDLAAIVKAGLKPADSDLARGDMSLLLTPIAEQYAADHVEYRADKGSLEDLGLELGLIEDSE